jgi:hypothetical protein
MKHPYRVIVCDTAGERVHRFSALHQAETFYTGMCRDAAMAGRSIRLVLLIGERPVWRY